MSIKRCYWAENGTEEERHYHDVEWGVPNYDDAPLFEMLLLEGAQAGLSWSTVLKKRPAYRHYYADFNPEIIAAWEDQHIEQLMQQPAIIRNRLKIESARSNARVFLQIVEQKSFADYIWQFVDGRPIQNHWTDHAELPAFSAQSKLMSKVLKKAGFRFVGETICYAYMQAVGMVNDHTVDCFRFNECRSAEEG